MATERYYSKVLSLPHSSAFFCLVCVTLPSFSSFSLYVAPSFCRFLSTFVFARFCRYCRCSSRVAAVFFCASPFSFCFPCFSLLFVRAVCLFSVAFWRVAAVFSVPRPFCSAFRSSRCYLCAPFAFFSIDFCFIVQQTQKACYMFNSSTNGKDITKKTCTGKIKAGDLVVKAWDNPPFHLYCSKRL